MSLPGPGTESHIENCQPYCSVCYFKVLARRYVSGPGGSETPRTYGYSYPTAPCTCCQTFDERIKWRPLESQERSLCTHCAKLQPSVALSVREAREQAELRHLTKQYLRCVNCDRGLNKEGLKWWGCSACKQECTSDYHMPWDKKHRWQGQYILSSFPILCSQPLFDDVLENQIFFIFSTIVRYWNLSIQVKIFIVGFHIAWADLFVCHSDTVGAEIEGCNIRITTYCSSNVRHS